MGKRKVVEALEAQDVVEALPVQPVQPVAVEAQPVAVEAQDVVEALPVQPAQPAKLEAQLKVYGSKRALPGMPARWGTATVDAATGTVTISKNQMALNALAKAAADNGGVLTAEVAHKALEAIGHKRTFYRYAQRHGWVAA